MNEIFEGTDIVSFDYAYKEDTDEDGILEPLAKEQHLLYSYYGAQPSLSVFDNKSTVDDASDTAIVYSAANNTLSIALEDISAFSPGQVVKLAGDFESNDSHLNGRSLTILGISSENNETSGTLLINTTGEGFPGDDFTMGGA